jgi:hypothetical protein
MKLPVEGDTFQVEGQWIAVFTAVDYKKKQALVKFFPSEEAVESWLAELQGELH